jgi:antitoxin YefM
VEEEMKNLRISEDILPIGEFKTHASRVIRKLQTTKQPLVITQNGKPAAVLLTPEEFDRLNQPYQFANEIDEGLANYKTGKIADKPAVAQKLDDPIRSMKQGVKKVTVRVIGQDRISSPCENTWDSYFESKDRASEDFMSERASQEQNERESL